MPSPSEHTADAAIGEALGSPRLARSANRFGRRKSIVAGASLVFVSAGALAATAYFLSGTGSGTATTQTSFSGLTLSNGTSGAALFPGGSTTLNVLVSNANSSSMGISTISLDTAQGTNGFSIDNAHVTAGCTVASAALSFPAQSTGWSVAPGASGAALVLGSAPLSMGLSAPSACQGASISVFIKAG